MAPQEPASHVVRPTINTAEEFSNTQTSITAFPTLSQPVLGTTLCSSIQTDLSSLIHQFKREMQELGTGVSHIENCMWEFDKIFNDLVDAHTKKKEEVEWLKSKVADLEDSSRCNNVKILGIPETVLSNDRRAYFTKILLSPRHLTF